MFRLSHALLLLAVLCLNSCLKDKPSLNYQTLQVGESIDVRDIHFLDANTALACGGSRNNYGAIFRSTDGGSSWQKVFTNDTAAINCLGFFDATNGFAGGDYLYLVKTTDGGLNWNFRFLGDTVPFHENQRPAFKEFHILNATTGWAVGGQNFDVGTIYKTTSAGVSWTFQSMDQETNSIAFSNATTGLAVGFGRVYHTTDGGITYRITDLDSDYFTGVAYNNSASAVAVGNDGGIYKSVDAGASWDMVHKKNSSTRRRLHFNDVAFANSYTGYAVGTKGTIFKTTNGGHSWEEQTSINQDELHAIRYYHNHFYIPSESGRVYVIKNQ